MNATDLVTETGRHCPLSAAARGLLGDGLAPLAFVERLLQAGRDDDALEFTAWVLPPSVAVGWGAVCAWQQARPSPPEPDANAFQAVVRWVQHPTEETRRAAQAAGEIAGMDKPAGALALAAFWSGGSMSQPGLPEVQPPPYLTAQTVAAALRLAAATEEAEGKKPFRRFVRLAFRSLQRLEQPRSGTPDSPRIEVSGLSVLMDASEEAAVAALATPPLAPAAVSRPPAPQPARPATRPAAPPGPAVKDSSAWSNTPDLGDWEGSPPKSETKEDAGKKKPAASTDKSEESWDNFAQMEDE